MLVTDTKELSVLFRRVLAGELQLYGFGAVRHFALYDWRLSAPFTAVFDNSQGKWGKTICGIPIEAPDALRTLDARTSVIMVLPYDEPFVSEIVRQVASCGPFPIVMFAGADALARILGNAADAGWQVAPALRPADAAGRAARFRALVSGPHPVSASDGLAALIERGRVRPRTVPRGAGRACLIIGWLNLGGAERQMVALAKGLRDAGWDVTLLADVPEPPESRHYVESLAAGGIDYRVLGFPPSLSTEEILSSLADVPTMVLEVLWHLPMVTLIAAIHYYRALAALQPHIVISYLDRPNLPAGVTSLLTGVPRILLSGRNHNPSNFPSFYAHTHVDMHWVYSALAHFPEVRLATNAAPCSRDYEEWLGVERGAIETIPNCLSPDAAIRPGPAEIEACCQLYGLAETDVLILGVFRLSPEKDPVAFLDVVERLSGRIARVRAIICGTGRLAEPLAAEIRERGLGDIVTLAGPVDHVAVLMARANLMLHTAVLEGMPNALLEAQTFGLPVVTTLTGGAGDCLVPDLLPFARAPKDVDGLYDACLQLLSEPERRDALAERIRAQARGRFSVGMLVTRTLAALGLDPGSEAA